MANNINVIQLYNQVNTLAKIYHAGYQTKEDFNNKLNSLEYALLDGLQWEDERNQNLTDHLAPFRKHVTIESTSTDGTITLPEDYAYKSALIGVFKENKCEGGVEVKLYPVYPLRSNEVPMVISDPIAFPSMDDNRFYLTFRNNDTQEKVLQLFPKELKGVEFTYLRYPKLGSIDFTYGTDPDTGEDFATPNPLTSVNLEWNLITMDIFKYMLLFLLGVEQKEPMLISASAMQRVINQVKIGR